MDSQIGNLGGLQSCSIPLSEITLGHMQVNQAQHRFRARQSPPRLSGVSTAVNLSESQADSIDFSGATKAGARPEKDSYLGRKIGAGVLAALSLTGTLGGVVSHVATHLPTCQEQNFPLNLENGEICLTRELAGVGYSGDSSQSYSDVADNLLQVLVQEDRSEGLDIEDLQELAASDQASQGSRDAARILLADPLLMNSMDLGARGRVDREITAEDLEVFLARQPDSGAFTFRELEDELDTKVGDQTAFQYFDARGAQDEAFSRDDLESISTDTQAPEAFRILADDFLENPNVFNGFDVANAAFRPSWLDLASGRQSLDGTVSHDDVLEVRYNPSPEVGKQWTAADAKALEALHHGEELGSDLFTAFHQTDRGNCVATAVIKAAMDHYGARVLKDFRLNESGGYNVVMHDGYRLSLTAQEMEAGATAAHFAGPQSPTKSYAKVLFASIAKRAQLDSHEGAQSFGQALLSVSNGERTLEMPHLLGLDGLVQKLDLSEVPGQDGAVVYGGGHSYYVDTIEGKTFGDRWGKATSYEGKVHVNEGGSSKGAIVLSDIPLAM